MRFRLISVAAATVALSIPAMSANATPVGHCPPGGGWEAIQFGDIAEIPAALFERVDFNEDGTLCAKILPANEESSAPTGLLIDNVVGGGKR